MGVKTGIEKQVSLVVEVEFGTFMLASYKNSGLVVYNRAKNKVEKILMSPSRSETGYTDLQKLIGYDYKNFPYLLAKSNCCILVIDYSIMEITIILNTKHMQFMGHGRQLA